MGTDNLHELRSKQRSKRIAKEMKTRSQTWLFVCEGKRTEPDYITALINYANTKSDRKIMFKVEGLGKNTDTLVNSVDEFYIFADDLRGKVAIPYSRTYVVFDRDSFGKDKFNNAISTAEKRGYIPIWSNECFELWLLLHFNLLETDIGREEYYKKLSICFGSTYDKSNVDFTVLLTDSKLATAMKNAKSLFNKSNHTRSYAKRCPCTTVFKIIEDIEEELCIKIH